MRFVRFSYYKTTNHIAPCDMMQCGAVWCNITCGAVRCGYALLQAVLVWFLQFVRFMWFGEHPYP